MAVALTSVADAILFRPLPVPAPNEIVQVFTTSKQSSRGYTSFLDYRDIARSARTVTGLVAQTQILAAVGGSMDGSMGGVPRIRMGLAVSPNYFDVLAVSAQRGRTFHDDDRTSRVIVLSDSLWRSSFGGDPHLVGQSIEIAKTPYLVVGIAPPGFGLSRFLHEGFYIPIETYAAALYSSSEASTRNPLPNRAVRFLSVYGRSKAGRSKAMVPASQAELSAITAQLEASYPETNRGSKTLVLSEFNARMHDNGSIPALAATLLLLAAIAFIAACSSAAGLSLMRAEDRAEEIQLRIALGAGTLQLLREAITESLLVGALGASMGLPVAMLASKLLLRAVTLPTDLPIAIDARLDARMMVVTISAALLSALICGLVPLWISRFGQVHRSALRVTSNGKWRARLVILQVALATAAVAVGAQMLGPLQSARQVELGYRLDHVLLMAFDPSQVRVDERQAREFYRELLEQVRTLPNVKNAVLAQTIPMGTAIAQKQIELQGTHSAVWSNTVTPGYFSLMHMALLAGRDFNESDSSTALPVVIVNETLAKTFAEGRALGATLKVNGKPLQVVGVVHASKLFQVSESPQSSLYVPFSQNYVSRMSLHVETADSPERAIAPVLAQVRAIDRAQPVSEIRSLETHVTGGALFITSLGIAVAFIAGSCILLLAVAGIYAVMAAAMRRRRKEIGIRQALGADHKAVLRLGLRFGLQLTLAGEGWGLLMAVGGIPLLGKFGAGSAAMGHFPVIVGPHLCAVLGILVANLVACFVPVWAAARVDPAVALREQ